ncbi:MAG: glycosyltransferase family 4 protein [Acidobacteria bacterium]|nr:glycosyltransferase family 4 protein [Acidobacteriota bacterium]
MNILYWTPMYWPDVGGIETIARQMVRALTQRGHRLCVVASHGQTEQPDRAATDTVPVYRFPFWQASVRQDLRRMLQIRKEVISLKLSFQPDVLHINFSGYTAYFQLSTADTSPVPTLVALYSNLAGSQSGPTSLLDRLLCAADRVVAASEDTLEAARRRAPAIENRSSVIYAGVDTRRPAPPPPEFRPPHLLCLGRLAEEKGIDVALRAFALLRPCHPDAVLTVAGDGPARADLEQLAASLGIDEAVRFTGFVSDEQKTSLFEAASIFILPSRCAEAFPLVALEAARQARPVVASRLGGLPEAVLHERTGRLVDAEDPAALAGAVRTLLADPEQARRMGLRGRERVLESFSLDGYIRQFEEQYARLVEKKNNERKDNLGS